MIDQKREAVKKAYGEYWDLLTDHTDNDGWVNSKAWIGDFGNTAIYGKLKGIVIESLNPYSKTDCYIFRPIALRGIKDNNGWISVKEHGLPIKWDYHLDYHVFDNEGYISTRTFTVGSEEYWKAHVTHYQIIIKPLPPIY
jgi:hypothetical protein